MKPNAPQDLEQLATEHCTLMRGYARVQSRCTEQVLEQVRQIGELSQQMVRLRARLIQRESELAWLRDDFAAWKASAPGLPKRMALARHVEMLLSRIQDLMRERLRRERPRPLENEGESRAASDRQGTPVQGMPSSNEDAEALELSLRAADLVICQTGCLSHGDYWRMQDHCKRTGKTCVLVEQPDALRIVSIHKTDAGPRTSSVATLNEEARR